MEIGKKEIEYLSKLARIEVSEEEEESLAQDLTKITDMVTKINELSTDTVDPLVVVTEDTHNFFRDDIVKPSLPIATIETLAPEFSNRCFVVPQVVE